MQQERAVLSASQRTHRKCMITLEEVLYQGFHLGYSQTDCCDCVLPVTHNEEQFLVLSGHYSRFVFNYSDLSTR